jgi:hypothetical protein
VQNDLADRAEKLNEDLRKTKAERDEVQMALSTPELARPLRGAF